MSGFNGRDITFQPPMQKRMEDMKYSKGRYSLAGGGGDMGFLPEDVPGLNLWHDIAYGVAVSGTTVTSWQDKSSGGHTASQATLARRPDYDTTNLINGYPTVSFTTASGDAFMAYTPWTVSTNIGTVYAVLKFVASTQYQAFMSVSAGGPSLYLGGDGVDFARNRPALYSGSDRAVWSADLVAGTNYLVKWAWDQSDAVNSFYWTQVNAETEVASGAFADAANTGNFNSLGLDPGIAATQDLVSRFAEILIYNRRLTLAEEARLRDYFSAKYKIVM